LGALELRGNTIGKLVSNSITKESCCFTVVERRKVVALRLQNQGKK